MSVQTFCPLLHSNPMHTAAGVWPDCRLETNSLCWRQTVGGDISSRIGLSVAADVNSSRSLRLRLHWSQKWHNTTVRTDARQGSRNQKPYCFCQRLHWNRFDCNVISPDCLAPTKWVCFEPTVWSDTWGSAHGIRVLLQCSYKYGHACRINFLAPELFFKF